MSSLATRHALDARSSSLVHCHYSFARWRGLLSFIASSRRRTIVRCHSSCARSSLPLARCHHPFARWGRLRSFVASRRRRTVVGRHSSCTRASSPVRRRLCTVIIRSLVAKDRGPPLSLVAVRQLFVIACALSSSVCLLWTIAIVRCFSSPVGDRSSPIVVRSSLVRSRSRVVIVQSLVVKYCDPSLLAVAG